MFSDLVQLSFDKIIQMRCYTVIVLKTGDKRFAIYVESHIGKILQAYLTDLEKPRPLTHDVISSVFKGLEIHVKHVVINDLQDTTYLARLFIEQIRGEMKHVVEIDCRPSDCLALAIMHNAPVWCTKEVLNKTIPFIE